MQKRISIPLFFIGFFLISFAQAQVKIGDNPQVIDPSSILELESSDKVLVITRVDSEQMATIVPNRGALVYNTTADCVYYYDGTAWISMCEGVDGGALTALPIENDESTIVITPTADGNNIEIAPNSISSDQILNGGINGVDIQDGSIGRGKLAPNAVDKARIAENAVGPYAIDRDSLGLSFFNNDAGFITGANIVSADADNAIVIGSDGGALFDATTIETSIATNAAAIAADNDNSPTNELQTLNLTGSQLSISGVPGSVNLPTATGSDTKINAGNNVTIQGNGTTATPYVINANNEIDGSVTNELQDLDFDPATNILTITNAATATNEVNLSALAGGGGTTAQINSTPSITVAGNGSALTPYELTAVGGGGTGTTEVADGTTITGVGTAGDPFKIEPSATTGRYLSTDATGVVWSDLPPSGASALFDANTISGTGLIGNEYTVADDAINSAKIEDGTIDLADLSPMGATANGEIIQWDITANAGAGGWTIADNSGGHTGTPNSIFFADDSNAPTDAGNEFFWDPNVREENGGNFGALGIGLDGGVMSTKVKIHVAEQLNGKLTYPIEMQNRTNQNENNSAVGMLFSVDLDNAHGKGALSYERTGAWGVGDFHFLQNTVATATNPTLADKSFSILSNKDIQLYGNLIARNGAGTDGQVLTTNAAGETVWGTGGTGTSTTNTTFETTDTDADGIDDSLTITDSESATVSILLSEINTTNASFAVTDADADGTDDSLTITDSDGTEFSVPLADISSGANTTNSTFEITDTDLDGTDDSITITDSDGTALSISLADISSNTNTTNSTFEITDADADGTDDSLTITDSDGTALSVALADIGSGANTTNSTFEITDTDLDGTDDSITITDSDGTALSISLADISSNTNTTNSTFEITDADADGTDDSLTITDSDGTALSVALADIGSGANTTNSTFEITDTDADGTDDSLTITDSDGTALSVPLADISGPVSSDGITITGDGGATTPLTVAPLGINTAQLADDAVTVGKIAAGVDGEVLSTNAAGETVWAVPENLENEDVTLAEDRTINLGGNDFAFDGSGNVGIGTDTPSNKLEVDGAIRAQGILNSDGTVGEPSFRFNGDTNTGMYQGGLVDYLRFTTGGIEAMTIDPSQNVGIGTATPAQKLHVAGSIQADGSFISNDPVIQIPDYVFQKYFLGNSELKESYNFNTLSEVEAFIKKNHHLPGVTSAIKAKEEGHWNLSNSNLQNLEKIEELFLHTIEQEKEINRLKAEKEAMANELKTMKNDIEEIKALLNK
ncbi:beta strand repeat-containing protein [Zobellia barbeyronii]|uniref:Uncharacterized protein n=1 Tax=Zobellia barbeyronii TaxID=2748009 RepID=A0ABS5WER1_9FLAO|nr:hypothetical protein [Zobellia barbeyronii]MBT2161886.1 hypothetical protein [Zobellia barbeyronii]